MRKRFLALPLLVAALSSCAAQAPLSASVPSSLIESRLDIADLVNSWALYRDQGAWPALLDCFHDDGTISLSWFDGPYKGFIAASQMMSKNPDVIVKHQLGMPKITIRGERAISEVNVAIMVRAKAGSTEFDITSHARFFDQIERRAGQWKIVKRTAIYEKDRVDPVNQARLPDTFFEGLDQYPAEFRFLAASLKQGGAQISTTTVFDKSPQMLALYEAGRRWLSAAAD